MYSNFTLGLDLGQAADYSALTAIERRWPEPAIQAYDGRIPPPAPPQYAARVLERYPLGTSYPAIIQKVGDLLERRTIQGTLPLWGCTLVVDGTGVGRAVVDQIRDAGLPCELKPVLITSGHRESFEDGYYHVPKVNLVAVMQLLLQSRRLIWDANLPHAATLAKELQTFSVKVNAITGNESFEAWRERDHDDIVLAVALACWYAAKNEQIGDDEGGFVVPRGPVGVPGRNGGPGRHRR